MYKWVLLDENVVRWSMELVIVKFMMTRLMTRFIEYSGYDFVNWILWNDEIQLRTQQIYEIPNFVGELKAVLLIIIGSRHMGGEGMLKIIQMNLIDLM